MSKGCRYRKTTEWFPTFDVYKSFKKKYPKYKDVSNERFENIFRNFSKQIVESVLNTREGIRLPECLGVLFIGLCEKKGKVFNYGKYKDNKQITYKNFDTDGLLMKIFYVSSIIRYRIEHFSVWSFKMTQAERRYLSKNFKNNLSKYIRIKNNERVSDLFTNKVTVGKNELELVPKNFNEFDL